MSPIPTRSSGELKVIDPEKRPMDEKELQRVLRKLDYHLLPMVILLAMLEILDRGNIGNAKILGMVEDANLTGLRYNILSAIYFIPYGFGEVPANIILKLTRPSRWLPMTALAWGVVVTLMCLCDSFKTLTTLRFFVGLAESAFIPGLLLYLITWYPRRYLAWRLAIFLSASVIAGAFGGLLAYGIEHMDRLGGLHGWQWIFCLEGIVTVLVALVAPFFIHDSIQGTKFLSISEKDYLQRAITLETSEIATHFDKTFIWQAFKDYRVYLHSISCCGILIPVYSFSLFLPTLVKELGYRAIDAQLLTVPTYVAACLCTLATAQLAQKANLRTPFIIIGAVFGIVGFIIPLCSSSSTLGYIAMFFATSGVYSADVAFSSWAATAYSGEMKRAVAIAIINGLGGLGGVLASFVYAHDFRSGYIINIGCLVVTILLTGFLTWDFNKSNRRKERQCQGVNITVELKAQWKNLGDQSPLFR